ncbi:MAG TPA: Hsp20/alpha crystallin family protein [Coleofasciculaceae cyanobacterium]
MASLTRWEPFQELERWEPFRDIERMQRQMNRLFSRLAPTSTEPLANALMIPSAEMEETQDAVHLKLEIPGLEAKDLHVEVTEDAVAVSGERKSETKTEDKGYVRSEFCYGKFERVIPLPAQVQNDKAQAQYKNGILSLTLPKAAGESKKSVKVNVS